MKRSQRNKQQQERVISPKFQEERKEKLAAKPILPLTEKQADYMREIKSKNLVIATGHAGTAKCLDYSTLIRTSKGTIQIGEVLDKNKDLPDGYYELDLSVIGLNGEEKASHFFKESNCKVFTVESQQGYSITATPEHPLFVLDNLTGNYGWVKMEDLNTNYSLCIDRNNSFDAADVEFDFEVGDTTYRKDVNIPKKMTLELAEWLGILVANGSTSKLSIQMSSHNPQTRKNFLELTKHLFNKDAKNVDKGVCIHSTTIREFLDYLSGGWTTARFKSTPRSVLQSSNLVKLAYLKGLFECDSCIYTDKNIFEYSTASATLANEVHSLLAEFGIVSRKYGQTVKWYGDHLYWKVVAGSSDYKKVLELILQSTDKYRYHTYDKKENTNIDVVYGAIAKLFSLFQKAKKTIGVKGNGQFLDKNGKFVLFKVGRLDLFDNSKELTFNRLDKMIVQYQMGTEYEKEIFREYYECLLEYKKYSFFHSKITDVYEDTPRAVYDLTVPETHSFVANNIVSHNTFLPSSIAADMYHKGEVNKIILSRPAVSDARSVGFFSGSKNDKMLNWVMPMIDVLCQRLGKPVVDLAIAEGNIELVPLETIKGRSFSKDVFVICDEAEDCTIEEIKSIVTRNANCKMVICGDIEQSALKSDSGLKILLDILEKSPELEEYIGIVDFNEYSDIVRSKICKNMIIAFHKAGY